MIARLRGRSVAVVLAVAVLTACIATGSAVGGPPPAVRAAAGLDPVGLFEDGRVLTLLSSTVLANGAVELALVLASTLLVVGACERVLGHRRALVAWLLTAVLGGLAGTGLQAAGLLARGFWTTPPDTLLAIHPETPVLGVLFTTSAFVGPLWRRRIRLVGGGALIVLLLYSGQPEDLHHLAGAAVGLALGLLMARRRPRTSFPRSSHHEARSLAAALVAVSAVGPIVAVVQPTGYGLLRPLGRLFRDPMPFGARVQEHCRDAVRLQDCERAAQLAHLDGPGALLVAVLPLVVLLVAAIAMARGRRAGAWLATGVSGLLALLGALHSGLLPVLGDPDGIADVRAAVTSQSVLAALVPLAVAAVAWRARLHCPVLPGRRVLRAAAVVVVGGVLAISAAHLVAGVLVAGQFAPRAGLVSLLTQLPERFVPTGFLRFRQPDLLPVGPVAALLDGWTGASAWLVLLAGSIGAFVSTRSTATGREQARLRALLREGAGGSISWMATWPGNRVWFSADGAHAVAYREAAGVALTVGEPVGPAEGGAEAARAFALHCDDLGLVPAFYAVRRGFADALGADGVPWSAVQVGEDTVIDPAGFAMRGKHWQDVRSSINRADRAGVRSVWTTWGALTARQRSQIEAISEEWVADRRLPELGFTLGGPDELVDAEVRLMLAVGPEDRIEAVTSWLPTWRDGEVDGLTLDFMRRRGGSPNGVMEFLIAAVIGAAQQRGLAFVSLSVAPLAGPAPEDERLDRVLAGLARLLEPAYGFTSLAAFKQKFRPVHVPQVVAFPDAVALPAIAVAVARAYLPDVSLGTIGRLANALRPDEQPVADGTGPAR